MNDTLPKSMRHKDYEIRPIPMKVIIENKEKWNTHFEIWEYKGNANTLFPFTGKETYDSREDAIKHCYIAGKYIIDNKPEKLIKE